MERLGRFLGAFLLAVLGFGVTLIAEEITLTTYYPAPFGNYEELQAAKLAIGSSTTMPTTDGNLAAVRIAVGSGATMPTTDGGITAGGTMRANTAFNFNGTDGATITFSVVTEMRKVGPNLQIKTATITVQGGIITDVDAVPNWQTL